MRAAGVKAEALWNCGVCSAADLKAAGYACEELMRLGFSERQLLDAGT
jgi:hypothetical protein